MSGVTLEEYMESMEVKPDGFKLTLVYWGREPVDTAHPLHMLLEMLKHQFDMEVKKADVVVMKHRFWQADLIWSGGEKSLVKTAQELDDILQTKQSEGHNQTILVFALHEEAILHFGRCYIFLIHPLPFVRYVYRILFHHD